MIFRKIAYLLPFLLCGAAGGQGGAALSFEEAEKIMLASNPQALSAAAGVEKAKNGVTAAKAGFYPVFSGNASYSRSGSQGYSASDSYSYGFSATQNLFSPEIPASLRSAQASLKISEASYDSTVSSLRYQLKEAFSNIINARAVVTLSSETLNRRKENLELIRLKYQAGRESKSALLETETSLKTALWQHENYKKDLTIHERKLNRLLGRPPREKIPELAAPAVPEPPEDFFAFSGRLENHFSLRSARSAVLQAKAAQETAKSSMYPSAAASGSYSWSGSDWPDSSNGWSLGASLSIPLFAGGRLSADLKAAKKSLFSAREELKNAMEEVSLSAEDAFLNWRQARLYIDVSRSSLEASKLRAWLVRKQYLAGQTSYFEWRNVEDQLISGENQYLTAVKNLALSHAFFIQSIGE
ncbi:MAG: hypothetical protein COT17_07545 [Elusimicrobia bacterium CG08_land_8_20_14_0_20_51_18]|nr:MAG: hypothetical protein COT17_07545 [Elusimicrobia bacterium CG08_land_8_20_14_0_20_51_18]